MSLPPARPIQPLQGYVSCEPELLSMEERPLHVALQAIPAKVRRCDELAVRGS